MQSFILDPVKNVGKTAVGEMLDKFNNWVAGPTDKAVMTGIAEKGSGPLVTLQVCAGGMRAI